MEWQSPVFCETRAIKDNILSFDEPNSIFNHPKILERLYKVETLFDLKIQYQISSGQAMPVGEYLGITQSWYTAVHCFGVFMYAPAIIFSSIAVECALNHDIRLDKERENQSDKWLKLNKPTLLLASKKGISVAKLLNEGESLEGKIQFIERRNKIAHGDYERYRQKFWQAMGMSPTEDDALDQIRKSREFILSWVPGVIVRAYEPQLP